MAVFSFDGHMGKWSYRQVSGVNNPQYQEEWVETMLDEIAQKAPKGSSVLDVGAGEGRFRGLIQSYGFLYRGQDFAAHIPAEDTSAGPQAKRWEYTELEFVCDILATPADAESYGVVCTEVLEHVPDPAAAFEKIWSLTKPGGFLAVTVPFVSLMHQAPYWFSAGLSPFWFAHHAFRLGITDFEIVVHGDYFDLMRQEIERLLERKAKFHSRLVFPFVVANRLAMRVARKHSSTSKRQMGAFGVSFLVRKPPTVG